MATWQDFAAQYGSGPLGALSGVHNSKLFDTMAGQIAKAIGYTGKTWTPGTYQFENANEGGTFTETAQGKQASPEFLKALEAFQFDRTGPTQGAISQGGQNVGTFTAGNKDTGFDKFAGVAVPLALSAIGGQLAGGLLAGGGSVGGSVGSSIGAGEGAAQLAAYTAANPLTAAEVMATTLPAGGLPGLGSAGGLLGGLPAITVNPMDAINAYTAANPVTTQSLLSGVPNITSAASAAPSVFNAAADSQAYNQAAGITGQQAASAATVPSTVNLTNAGGTMGTAGGLQGLLQTGGQMASDALGAVKDVASPTWQFLKDNPTLGRLLLGGATSLLSGAGGGSSGGSGASTPVNPIKWNSSIQQGLLAPVQQYAPDAIQQRPSGLLAQGNAGAGAWRFLGG